MRAPSKTIDQARRLRRALTFPEVLLWQSVRGKRLGGLHFRRQHAVGSYILDFYCSEAKLAVEVDGSVHDDPVQAAYDIKRDAWFARQGIRVLRIAAPDILDRSRLNDVLATIEAAASAPSTVLRTVPLPR